MPANCKILFSSKNAGLEPRVPANDKTAQIILIIKKPIIRLFPDIQYHANPKNVKSKITPIIYSIFPPKY